MAKTIFRTDIKHGRRYRDRATGFEGTATAVYFFEHGCERVNLKGLNGQGEVVEYVFDAPELEDAETRVRVQTKVPGGPHDRAPVHHRGPR